MWYITNEHKYKMKYKSLHLKRVSKQIINSKKKKLRKINLPWHTPYMLRRN